MFIIILHYERREKAILGSFVSQFPRPYSVTHILMYELQDNKHLFGLEYVQLNVPKVLGLLEKVFAKR